jgi:asparagine synthase (glutamine-hydrolysing)
MLDGVFSFILLDSRSKIGITRMYIARDPFGVRPLYWLHDVLSKNKSVIAFASEIKMLCELKTQLINQPPTVLKTSFNNTTMYLDESNNFNSVYEIDSFPPGHFAEVLLDPILLARWKFSSINKYYTTGFNSNILMNSSVENSIPDVIDNIQRYLMAAVFKRCCTTDRPIACLLSGGLDSSLITALVVEYHRIHGLGQIETYSIGLAGSEDLRYAKIVADYLDTKHTEILLTEADFIAAVPDVIKAIESYDTTTVRASIGNWLLGKYISEHSEAKVIFNGDGSDELCGGYLYMHLCPDAIEFDKESRRLLANIHQFDVLRSDRCISSHGLEPRTPFLDRSWVQYYLSILPELRFHPNFGKTEKYLLRTAFYEDNFRDSLNRAILPHDIIWRRKEAFSDGVSKTTRSLYQILNEAAEDTKDSRFRMGYSHNSPITEEQKWYRYIFSKEYPNMEHIIPYFWMPRYVDAKDASARTLEIYSKSQQLVDDDDDSV